MIGERETEARKAERALPWTIAIFVMLSIVGLAATGNLPSFQGMQLHGEANRFLHTVAASSEPASVKTPEGRFQAFIRSLGAKQTFSISTIPMKFRGQDFLQCNLRLHGRTDGKRGCVVFASDPQPRIAAFYEARCSEETSRPGIEAGGTKPLPLAFRLRR